jgi:hypothetical protein
MGRGNYLQHAGYRSSERLKRRTRDFRAPDLPSAHPVAAQDRASDCSARPGPPRCHRMRLGGRADGEAGRTRRIQEPLVVGDE